MLKAFTSFALFISAQLVTGGLAMIYCKMQGIAFNSPQFNQTAGTVLLVCDLVLIAMLVLLKLARRNPAGYSKPRPLWLVAIIGSLLMSVGIGFVSNALGIDDGGSTRTFEMMRGNFFCILTLCLVGPLTEEYVFREGIVRSLVQKGWNPSWAIITGAVLFALVHGNLLQGVAALPMGIVFGYFFLRTGGIALCGITHVLNNAVAIITLAYPSLDNAVRAMPLVWQYSLGSSLALIGLGLVIYWWQASRPVPALYS